MKVKKHVRSKIIQNIAAIVREYVFLKIQKTQLFTFFEVSFQTRSQAVARIADRTATQ